MRELADLDCRPWQGREPPLSTIEIQELLSLIPGWELVEEKGAQQLRRAFEFQQDSTRTGFIHQMTQMAAREDHHPGIQIEAGKVTVTWWTQVIQGLHRNDFILAARTSRLYFSNVA
jgi:4a-hydroxytetrahydrobiopterin dehydratase